MTTAAATLSEIIENQTRFAVALTVDAPVATPETPQRCPRTGALIVLAPLTWSGVRLVPWQGKMLRMYRAQSQVNSENYRKTLRGLVATLGHPDVEGEGGKYMPGFVHALAGEPDAPAPPPGYAWVKPEAVSVGFTGDEITDVQREGFTLPMARVYITGSRAQSLVLAGLTQTSLGHMSLLDFTPGSFKDPVTGEEIEYDVEQVLDSADPRIQEAVAAKLVPKEFVEQIGGNHFAVAIALGRGLGQAELEAIGVHDAGPGEYALPFRISPTDSESPAASFYGVLWPDRAITVRSTSGEPADEVRYDSLESFAETHLLRGGSRIEFATANTPIEKPAETPPAPTPETPQPGSEVIEQKPPTELLQQHDATEEHLMKTCKIPTTALSQAPLMAAMRKANLAPAAIGDQAVTVELPDSFDMATVVPMLTSLAEALAAAQTAATDAEGKLAIKDVETAQNAAQIDSLRAEAEAGRAVIRKDTIVSARTIATLDDAEIEGKNIVAIKRIALAKVVPTMATANDSIVTSTFDYAVKNAAKLAAAATASNDSNGNGNGNGGSQKRPPTDDPKLAGGSDSGDDEAGAFGM